MAITNHERVGKALELLRVALLLPTLRLRRDEPIYMAICRLFAF